MASLTQFLANYSITLGASPLKQILRCLLMKRWYQRQGKKGEGAGIGALSIQIIPLPTICVNHSTPRQHDTACTLHIWRLLLTNGTLSSQVMAVARIMLS